MRANVQVELCGVRADVQMKAYWAWVDVHADVEGNRRLRWKR